MSESGNTPPEFDYSKEDYLNTEAPYAALYAIRSPFSRLQTVKRMAAHASSVGVTGFDKLWQAYRRSQEVGSDLTDHESDVALEPIHLNTGLWTVDEFGVRRCNGMQEDVACGFPVYLTRRFEDIDNGCEKVELSFKKGGRWKSLIIPCGQCAEPKRLVSLSDVGLNINLRMAGLLSDYLTDLYGLNYAVLPFHHSVHRLGWIGDEREKLFSPFVTDLQYDGDPEYKPIFQAIREKGSFAQWRATAARLRAESVPAHVFLAASFASVLVRPLGILPFFVHLWGTGSGTGKTVALMGAASVWANPEPSHYIKSFDGTDVGYERFAAFLNSLPLCLDELQLARRYNGKLQFNVYRLTQGVGRVRGNKAGGVDETPTWANCILTTGETPLTDAAAGAGAMNRVLNIEVPNGQKVVQDGHYYAEALKASYGFAGQRFVAELAKPEVLARLRALHADFARQLSSRQSTDKQALSAAALLAADTLATELFWPDGAALTVDELAEYLVSEEQASTGSRAYNFLMDWLSQNESNFLRAGAEVKGPCYGVIDDEFYYINGTVFRDALTAAGYSPESVLSYLRGENLIKPDGRNLMRRKSIGATRPRCVWLKNNVLTSEESEQIRFDYEEELL